MPRGLPDSFLLTGALRLKRRLSRGGAGGPPGPPGKPPIGYKLVNLKLFKPVIDFELRTPFGTVGRYIHKVANRITQRARLQVGVKTGRLRASIRFRHIRRAGETAVKIGGYTHYARMHHEGTRPHIITPNKTGGNLVFMKGSRIIRTPLVNHPGTKPNRYLTDQLRPRIARRVLR
jgi:hypothetical protein